MNSRKIVECEQAKIEKWSKFQLPNLWKSRGAVFSLLVFVAILTLKFTDGEPEWLKAFLRRALLLGFLVVSVSKEKIEDEMMVSMRAKSYTLAFIFAVLYAFVQPAVDYVIGLFVYDTNLGSSFSYFQVLSFMLIVQIMFFEILKRNR